MTGAHAAPPTARDVILAALSTVLPCPKCGRTEKCRCLVKDARPQIDRRADLVVAALIEHGHLPSPDAPVGEREVEDVAKWLAAESRHPRYTAVEDGWRRLMTSDADVEVAAANAQRYATTDGDMGSVKSAKGVLLRWHRDHPQ